MKRIVAIFLVLVAATITIPHEANASGDSGIRGSGDFKFIVAPYAWLTNITARINARKRNANVNVSFLDVLGSGGTLGTGLNIAAMSHVEVIYKDTIGVLSDINFASLGTNLSARSVSLSGKSTLFLADIVPFYRFGTWSVNKAGSLTLDGLAGVRVWNVRADFDFDLKRFSPSISKETSWVDPIVGARATWQFNEDWSLNLRGGLGGFGICSDFTWDTTGLVGYTLWKQGTLYLGYRAVGVNREGGGRKDALKVNGTLHGPIVGVAFNF